MKKVLALVLALVMVLSMAACGNDANKQGDAEKEVTKIRLAHDYSPKQQTPSAWKTSQSWWRRRAVVRLRLTFTAMVSFPAATARPPLSCCSPATLIWQSFPSQYRCLAVVLSALLLPRQRQRLCRLSG